ncbi:MAG TPA: GlsB/YeaQ/YmgE family stress response membrane protein [Candidatus Acidoferrum sp.]|nr:GlsB/YeaQ/YmgE family stress response membrane protein [Candidatus Acidoferrum sp.]
MLGNLLMALVVAGFFQEHIVIVEWERGLLGWILLGLIAGWLAGKIARGRGFGCIGDILLGLIGSVVGGWLFTKLGIVHANTFLFSLAAATVGAVILVSIAHLFFGGKGQ